MVKLTLKEGQLERLTAGLSEEDKNVIHMVYMGREFNPLTGETAYKYAELKDGADPMDDIRRYSGNKGRNFVKGRPGVVYAFASDREGNLYINRSAYMGQYEDADRVTRWIAEDTAAERAKTSYSERKKELRANLALQRLEPFRQAYNAAIPSERPYLLAWIIGAVTSARELK